ncbi:MAG: hypothetical protein E3J35_01480, partial [Methanomassiliicoccales archaeon]
MVVVGILVVLQLHSFDASAETRVVATDPMPTYVNRSSDPVLAIALKIDNNSQGLDYSSKLNWMNITFTNVSDFFPSDLASLSNDTTSGVAVYNETDGTPGFSGGDTRVGTVTVWFGTSPNWYVNITSLDVGLFSESSDNTAYIVLRTSDTIFDGDKFNVSIGINQINATYGNAPAQSLFFQDITADTLPPASSVNAISPYWYITSPITIDATAN